MANPGTFVALAVGSAIAIAVVAPAWLLSRSKANEAAAPAVTRPDPTAESRALLGRVAKDFIAVRHSEETGQAIFYEQPLPYGDALCRIRSYAFAHSIANGGPFMRSDYPFEKLIVEDFYAVWSETPPPARLSDAREPACAKYRDFEHLISGDDGTAIERAVYVLARAVRDARRGTARYSVSCFDHRRREVAIACDGLALLRATSARDIRRVSTLDAPEDRFAFDDTARSVRHMDDLEMNTATHGGECGQREVLDYRIVSQQTFGEHSSSQGELRSIVIRRSSIC